MVLILLCNYCFVLRRLALESKISCFIDFANASFCCFGVFNANTIIEPAVLIFIIGHIQAKYIETQKLAGLFSHGHLL